MKSKSALRMCLSLFICFTLLIGAESFLPNILTLYPEWFGILLDTASMLIPILLLHLLMPRKEVFRPRFKLLTPTAEKIGFTLCISAVLTLLRFTLDELIFRLSGEEVLSLSFTFLKIPFGNAVSFFAVLLAILIPALAEELYLRGYVQTFLSEYLSTRQVLIVMAVVGAILYGSLGELPGGLLFSLGMSWIAFLFGSFWYAVFAHWYSAALYLFIGWMMEQFQAFNILHYLPALAIIFALLSLYIALRLAERLMLRQDFKKLHYVQYSDYSMGKFVWNAASLAFLFVFIAKSVIGII